jgi:hypothetical protein
MNCTFDFIFLLMKLGMCSYYNSGNARDGFYDAGGEYIIAFGVVEPFYNRVMNAR